MASQPNDYLISSALVKPRLPILGNIKIGGKRSTKATGSRGAEFQPPVKYDHFVVTTLERGEDGNFNRDQAVHAKIGPKPTELDVWLPFESIEDNFYAQMVQYGGRTRTYQCNGERGTNLSTGVSAPCQRLLKGECGCKPFGRLAVILGSAPTFGGLHVFRTTAWGTVVPMQTEIKLFHEQFGSLWGLPLRLKLYPATVRYKDTKQVERTTTAYRVALVLRANFEEAANTALEVRKAGELVRREAIRLLPGTRDALAESDREEAPHIQDEFFPDAPGGGRSSLGKLAQINASIAADAARADAPVAEVVDEPQRPAVEVVHADGLDDLVRELEALLEEFGPYVTAEHMAKLRDAIERRSEADMRAGIQWLDKRISNDVSRLKFRRLQARARLLIDHDDEQAIADTLEAGDPATIRMWTQVLDERLNPEPAKPDSPAEPETPASPDEPAQRSLL